MYWNGPVSIRCAEVVWFTGSAVRSPALDWHEHGAPRPLIRGDELARDLGIEPGPALGELLAELAAAQYAGEIATREDALSYARRAAAPSPR